jgi:7,8-dihydroneopterin aldolase/epimerase/oxygenase
MTKPGGGAPLSGGVSALWAPDRSHLRVILRDLVIEASVGLHPWEQHKERPTRLVVNIEMFAPLDERGLSAEDEARIIDYDHIRDALKTWHTRPHTKLLETLLNEIVALCFRNSRVDACRVSILKPDIFGEAAAVGVEVYMRRQEWTAQPAESRRSA